MLENNQIIDADGYRANVGIVICHHSGDLFWAKRRSQNAWQFPQGGMLVAESPEQSLFRELREETGLMAADVNLLMASDHWYRYDIPAHLLPRDNPQIIGQKQKWFLLELVSPVARLNLNICDKPEFEDWRWINYWQPLKEVVEFKKGVYQKMLEEFRPLFEQKFHAANRSK